MRLFIVREAEVFDLEDCAFFEAQDSQVCKDPSLKRLDLATAIAARNIFLACDDNGKPIGYLRIAHLWPAMMPMGQWVFVDPAWRRKGVMSGLFDFVCATLAQRGHSQIMFSVQSDRPVVLEFMRERGLKEIGQLGCHGEGQPREIFFSSVLSADGR